MRLWRVCAAIRSTPMPASAALVAWPARSECPVIRSGDRPAARARSLNDVGDGVAGDRLERGESGTHAGEHRPGGRAPDGKPGVQGGDGVGEGVLAMRDADDLAATFGVGLGAA